MEGPKPFVEKSPNHESLEAIDESVERALELLTELQQFHDIEVVGGEAMALNNRAEELAKELKATLSTIPMKDCIENNLPYHPSDVKPEVSTPAFPAKPDYPLSYTTANSSAMTNAA
jgi:hypothetical protein